MSTVYVGSASIDERGKASGGAAGDQTGREVRTQAWYKHEKGWVVIRAKDDAVRAKIAEAMRAACDNPLIGYDQGQRDTLYNASKAFGFNPALVAVKCECDCSSLVRVCCCYAGVMVGNFRTVSEPEFLEATGRFNLLSDAAYTDHSDRLMAGDILCTPVSGHTVVVLNDGDNAREEPTSTIPTLTRDLYLTRPYMKGDDVAAMQRQLIAKGYRGNMVDSGIGEFGPNTDKALRKFQTEYMHATKLVGICGAKTWAALFE
jgi:hypothetical protein